MINNFSHLRKKTNTKIDFVLKKFDEDLKKLQKLILFSRTQLKNFSHPQVHQDFKSICFAFKKLTCLHQKITSLQNNNISADDWHIYRHDLKNFIGTIKGYAELILETLQEISDHTLEKNFQDLVENSVKLLPYLEDIKILDHADSKTSLKNKDEKSYPLFLNQFSSKFYPSTILIIDDSRHKRDLISRRLKQMGHTIITATNGFEGLKKLDLHTVDLILLDILMPDINGYEVLKKIKASSSHYEIPVLIISSVNELDNVVQCIQAGADDYLPMSVDPIFLQARINACLEKKFLRDHEKQQHIALDQAQKVLQAAIESIDEGFIIYDQNEKIITYNQRFSQLYHLDLFENSSIRTYKQFLETMIAKNLYISPNSDQDDSNIHYQITTDTPLEIQSQFNQERRKSPYREQLTTGQWIEVFETSLSEGGIVALHKDITVEVTKQARMSFHATHDSLTKLVNRYFFEKSLKQILIEAQQKNFKFALFYIDLDDFKKINDTLGHDAGDFILKEVAVRLNQSFRTSDLIARLGGDEFCVAVINIENEEEVISLAHRVLTIVGKTVNYKNDQIVLSLSLGISFYPKDGLTIENLMKYADMAMYQAKKARKGSFYFAHSLNLKKSLFSHPL